jgi:hypothetical protein
MNSYFKRINTSRLLDEKILPKFMHVIIVVRLIDPVWFTLKM